MTELSTNSSLTIALHEFDKLILINETPLKTLHYKG